MSRFRENLWLIPRAAWLVAVLCYAGLATLFIMEPMRTDPAMRSWPLVGKVLFAAGIPLLLLVVILLVGYIYADAKRRGMRYVMWTLLALFVPNAIGIILYFLLRDPLPAPCPSCGNTALGTYAFCPQCGAVLKPTCPHCGKAVEPKWPHCPHCGTKVNGHPVPAS